MDIDINKFMQKQQKLEVKGSARRLGGVTRGKA
jgi:hypothetical protein